MAKRKTVKKTAKTAKSKKPRVMSDTQQAVQQALQVTWLLKGSLKNAQLSYLRVGKLLTQVKEESLYARLKHPDIEDYAAKRLGLQRASLYRYLQVYEWVREFHPEWLKPKPEGFIPELSDVSDLMWIERKLAEKGLHAQTRSELNAMRDAALNGTLRDSDLEKWKLQTQARRKPKDVESLLARVVAIRRQCVKRGDIPPEAITHFDAAIQIIGDLAAGKAD